MRHFPWWTQRLACTTCVALTVLSGCDKTSEAPRARPEEFMERVAETFSKNQPRLLWDTLPPSYQQDLRDLVKTIGERAQPALWNRTFAIAGKLAQVLRQKKEMVLRHPILEHPQLAALSVREHWDSMTTVLEAIASSDIASHAALANLDIEKFLDGPGAKAWKALVSIMVPLQGEEAERAMRGLLNATVTCISSDEETALVKVESPGMAPEPYALALVEGKWILVGMKNTWPENIAKARDSLSPLNVADSEVTKSLELLDSIEVHLDGMLAASTNKEFSSHLTQLVAELQALAPPPIDQTMPPVPLKQG